MTTGVIPLKYLPIPQVLKLFPHASISQIHIKDGTFGTISQSHGKYIKI